MNKLILLYLILFISVLPLKSKDVLRWAADAESGAPYVFQDPRLPTNLIGFEVEIIKAIADELGMDNQHIQNQWDGLIPGLNRNDYDVAINGLEITEDRKKVVLFSVPYYVTYQQLVVRIDNLDISSMRDLIGKKVGTLKGSLAERMLRDQEGIKVFTYDSEVNSYEELQNGRLEAVLIDHPVALYYAGWNPNLKLVGEPIGEVVYGLAMRKSDTLLAGKINTAISNLITSGKLREILDSWNMWNYMVATYLGDKSETKVKAKNYENFILSQKTELSFSDYVDRYVNVLPSFIQGAYWTILISILAMIFAILLGMLLALTRVYAPKWLSYIAIAYIELFRGTPLLIQLLFIYYALPQLGLKLDSFVAAVVGLGLNYAAYEAENYRAGLFSVPKGQMEAAISLGMTKNQAIRHIIIPQAIRLVIPPVTNDFIALLKDSSLVAIIAMTDLTKVYMQVSSTYYDYIVPGILVAIFYLLIGLPFVRVSKYLEEKYSLDNKNINKKSFKK